MEKRPALDAQGALSYLEDTMSQSPTPDDFTFLWRTIITVIVTLGLPWVIKISNDIARLKTLVEGLVTKLDEHKATTSDRLNAQGSRHRGLEKRVSNIERRK